MEQEVSEKPSILILLPHRAGVQLICTDAQDVSEGSNDEFGSAGKLKVEFED